jgi:NodT family efflux transporter outer membrane factor (OMF) lipoprotein
MRRLLTLTLALTLGACTVGPNYRPPQLATPARFAEPAPGAADQTADLSRWWTQLGDPELDSLIDRALAQNLDLKNAVSRVAEARQAVRIARAAELPSASAAPVALRRDVPFPAPSAAGNTNSGSASTAGLALPNHLHLYSLGGDVQWQVDLFGGARRGVEAARAEVEASLWQARDSQVSLSAEVARDYLMLRQAQARKAVAQADIQRLQDLLGLVHARRRFGLDTELDVNQQLTALYARQVSLPQDDKQIRSAAHALAVLLAENPTALDAELIPKPLPAAPLVLPVGLPSDLLRRRPDIRAAERQLAAATAQIGVAVADQYPKLDLIGLASFTGTDLGDLLKASNLSGISVADGSWSIFSGGRLRAAVRQRREEARQAELGWRQTVLTALREVEDALSAYAADTRQTEALDLDLKTARDTAQLTDQRYRSGLSAFTDVLLAEAAIESAEDQWVTAQSARIENLTTLYAALGGGWR